MSLEDVVRDVESSLIAWVVLLYIDLSDFYHNIRRALR
jgi:hypothetical protein